MADTDADKRRDKVLKRMLSTPPKPHKPAKGEDTKASGQKPKQGKKPPAE